jgi:urocanate hydratase
MSLIKQIALEHNDLDLFKFACELEKEADIISAITSTREALSAVKPGSTLQESVSDLAKKGLGKFTAMLKPSPKAAVEPIKRFKAYQSGIGGTPIGR